MTREEEFKQLQPSNSAAFALYLKVIIGIQHTNFESKEFDVDAVIDKADRTQLAIDDFMERTFYSPKQQGSPLEQLRMPTPTIEMLNSPLAQLRLSPRLA